MAVFPRTPELVPSSARQIVRERVIDWSEQAPLPLRCERPAAGHRSRRCSNRARFVELDDGQAVNVCRTCAVPVPGESSSSGVLVLPPEGEPHE